MTRLGILIALSLVGMGVFGLKAQDRALAVVAEPQEVWPPAGILLKLIQGAQDFGPPLASQQYKDGGRTFNYELFDAKYVTMFESGDPPKPVYVARMFFVRSSPHGSDTPPALGHHFVVYFDQQAKVRKHVRIESDTRVTPEIATANWANEVWIEQP